MPRYFTVMTVCPLLHNGRLKRIRAALPAWQPALSVLGIVILGVLALAAPAIAVGTAQKAASTASAATSEASSNPGQNLVTWLAGWVGGLFAIAVGGAGIAVAFRRHVGEGLALLLVAVMVGGFIVDPSDMQSLTTAIWHKIATGA
jgi:hypothetical protein